MQRRTIYTYHRRKLGEAFVTSVCIIISEAPEVDTYAEYIPEKTSKGLRFNTLQEAEDHILKRSSEVIRVSKDVKERYVMYESLKSPEGKLCGYVLLKEYPGSEHKKGYVLKTSEKKYLEYPHIWKPFYN
jgi:hypothetical protein